MARLILEKEFDPPLTEERHNLDAQRTDPCLEAYGARWIRSYLSTDRRRIVCEFEAADAEAVRSAFRSAGVPFTRVWTAEVFEPGGGAHGGWRERVRARESAQDPAREGR
jgi:Protein of unknown function (DUF4242)